MGMDSKIEWTRHTWNPWRGCTKVSPGCANCYADSQAKRNPSTLGVWGPGGKRVVASEAMWREPAKWNATAKAAGERHRVFCASMADVFEDWKGAMHHHSGAVLMRSTGGWCLGSESDDHAKRVTMDDVRDRLFSLIDDTPNLDWLLLTKRPENFTRFLPQPAGIPAAPDNVWLGVSAEDRQHGLPRMDFLRVTPARVRFLSIEPLLEDLGTVDLSGIHWVIVGGESGHHARPLHPDWVRSLRDQCQVAGVAFCFKQWGEYEPVLETSGKLVSSGEVRGKHHIFRDGGRAVLVNRVGKKEAGRLLDGREWSEFPLTETRS